MKHVVVLGSGLVGSLMAKDLALDGRYSVTAADRSEESLGRLRDLPNLVTERADLASAAEIHRLASKADVVVGAVPGFMGTAMLKAVLEAKKPIADISFAPEDPFTLDELARASGVPAIVDCGVSPGLSNLAAGRAESLFEETDLVRIMVGGLPFRRVLPYEYRIVFSATDVIEEYTRPARLVRDGRLITVPALSEPELFEFAVAGTLEGFLTDGLRTVLRTVKARNLEEKTLRFPGHAAKIALLRDTGLLSNEPILVNGVSVSPRAVTEAVLFPLWKLPLGDEEFTVLRVVAEGRSGGRRVRRTYELFDRTDAKTGATSMARTTGFPCTIAARLLAEGVLREPGVRPLELLGKEPSVFGALVDGLLAKGVVFTERAEEIVEASTATQATP